MKKLYKKYALQQVFHDPLPQMYKILCDNPYDSLERPNPSASFNPEAERKELAQLESGESYF